jgi:hypothetical protein
MAPGVPIAGAHIGVTARHPARIDKSIFGAYDGPAATHTGGGGHFIRTAAMIIDTLDLHVIAA